MNCNGPIQINWLWLRWNRESLGQRQWAFRCHRWNISLLVKQLPDFHHKPPKCLYLIRQVTAWDSRHIARRWIVNYVHCRRLPLNYIIWTNRKIWTRACLISVLVCCCKLITPSSRSNERYSRKKRRGEHLYVRGTRRLVGSGTRQGAMSTETWRMRLMEEKARGKWDLKKFCWKILSGQGKTL